MLEPCGVVVRVGVALAVAARLRGPGMAGQAEHRRQSGVPMLADVLARLPDRDRGGVRLRRASEVDRSLREVQLRLGEAHVLERLSRGSRNDERVRVGVADVLEARMTMRRAMKRGSSPASSIAAR